MAAVVLLVGLAAPLALAGALAVAELLRSPLESDRVTGPVVAAVERAERRRTEVASATFVPADDLPVLSRSAGTVTSLNLLAGVAPVHGDVVMEVDGEPVLAFAAPAPLYRDLTEGMNGDDVRAAQELLVALGHLGSPDRSMGPAAVRAVRSFNAEYGRGSSPVLAANAFLWVPESAGPPKSVSIRVGDVLEPMSPVYVTADGVDRIVLGTDPSHAERVLSAGDVDVPIPPGTVEIVEAADVATVRDLMGEADASSVVLAEAAVREVGTVPASAVVIDSTGTICFFAGADGPAVVIDSDSGGFGLVDVEARLIGSPVLVNPRGVGREQTCA